MSGEPRPARVRWITIAGAILLIAALTAAIVGLGRFGDLLDRVFRGR